MSTAPTTRPAPVENAADLSNGARTALVELLSMLARGEHDTARLYAPLQLSALSPTLRLAFANVVRDELRHALVAQRLLLRLGADAEEAAAMAGAPRTSEAASLDRADVHASSLTDELDGIVLLFLLDRAAGHRLADLAWCSWAPLARAMRTMAHEELGHVTLGNHHVRELALRPERRTQVQQSLDRWFGQVVTSFGVDNDPEAARWVEHGLQTRSVADLREGFIEEVRALVTSWKLTLPSWTPPWHGQAPPIAAATAVHYRLIGG